MALGKRARSVYEFGPFRLDSSERLHQSPYVLEWLARLFAVSGNITGAHKVLDELTRLSRGAYVDSYYLAAVYPALGQKQEAIALLERACEERSCWLSRLRVDPIFDGLRPAPGFDIVLMKVGGIH